MIIHNPIISGSIQFPADADGNKVTLQVNSGVLETIQIDSSNNATSVKPESNLSGSFTGSFQGDGSALTGVSSINIDALNALGGATVAQGDNLVISDAGTEKKVTFSNLEDSIFGNISGNATIAAGGVLTIASSFLNTSLNAATGSYLTTVDISDDTNLAVSDTSEVNMILNGDTLSAELIGGVVSGSDQIASTFAQTILDDTSAGAVRTTIGVDAAGTVNYTLPTNLAGDNIDIDTTPLTGATVISDLDINITTNTSGLVTDANGTVSTRDLTPSDLGLGNVDNTSDANKPVSTAGQTALNLKANLASPTFTGTPISTTPSANDDSTKIATTAYVQAELTELIGTAPATLDTLGEISASIANGDSDVVALTTTVGTKLAKSSNLSDLANASTARTNLGLVIGTDVQAFNSTLGSVAGGTYAGDNSIVTIGTVTTGNVQAILPSGVVSGSDQVNALASDVNNNTITFTAGDGLDGGGVITLNQSSDETVTFTVSDGVVSGSDQIASTFAQTILDDTSAGAVRTTIGVDAAGTDNSTDVSLSGTLDYITISGQVITRNQITNDDLAGSISNSKLANSGIGIGNGGTIDLGESVSVADILKGSGMVSGSDQIASTFAQTILDDTSAAAVRTTIGVDAAGTINYTLPTNLAGDNIDIDTTALTGATVISDLDINITTDTSGRVTDANGSVGTRTLTAADLSLGNVTNESKATMFSSPALTGNPTAPTQADNDNSTKIATTAYVQREVSDLLGGAPAAFDTLLEISASIANGDSDVVSLTTVVGGKLQKDQNLSDLPDAGEARTNLGVDAAGTDNSTDVTLANTNYLSISGQAITGGTIPIGSGGTGATSAGAARTALGVDAAGTDNSTDVTLVTTSHDYLSISGQAITLGTIQNNDLASSSITIDGSAISLGGSVTTLQLGTSSSTALAGNTTTITTDQASAITANTAKNTNVSTDLGITGTTGARTITSSDGTNAIIPLATTSVSGLLSPSLFDEIDANTAKVSDINHNVSTNLSEGTATETTVDVNSSDGSNATLVSASTTRAGLLTKAKFDEIVANTAKVSDINHNVSTDLSKTTSTTNVTINSSDGNNVSIGAASTSVAGVMTKAMFDKLDGIAASANNYSHPTFNGDDLSVDTGTLSGATVISDLDFNVTTDTNGHVTDATLTTLTTRTLTLANLGYTGDTDATDDQTATEIRTLIGSGNDGHVPSVGSAGEFLKHDGTFGTPSYTTNTDVDVSVANLKTRLGSSFPSNAASIGDSNDTITIPGNLVVTGTTTTNNVETVSTSNGVVFEGNAADDNEITLIAATVSADRTITLPNATGTIALTSDIPTSNSSLTNGEGYISSFDITTQTDSKYLRSNASDSASGVITFSNSTASTSKTTGAVIVTGGVGIGGALNVGGDVVAYASSDERLKDNIELISNPIEKVQSLKGVTWDWNDNADELQQSLPNVGVIAQDVEKVLPQLVTDRDNGFKGVDYAKLTGLLIEAIKDQQKQIDELKSKLS
jgi:hypothetical protein